MAEIHKLPVAGFSGATPAGPAHQVPMPPVSNGPAEAGHFVQANGGEPVSVTKSDPLTAFDRFMAVYPRYASVGTARGRWIWAMNKAGGDHDLIIRGAAACAAYHQSRHTAIEFIAKPHAWLDAEGWLDRYELPKAPQQAPQEDSRAILRRSMEAKAAAGSRFAADWLKRNQ